MRTKRKLVQHYISNIWQRIKHNLNSPARTFALFASIFGGLIILLAPPFTGADEEAHFIRAYGITEGQLVMLNTDSVEMPKSYRQTIGCFQTKSQEAGKIYTYQYKQYGLEKRKAYSCAKDLPLSKNDTEKIITTASSYSPTTYIPQSLSIFGAKLFDAPILVMAYLARFAVMFTYIAMIVLAIKLLPVRKWALVGVALLPHSITHFTNPGGDYMLYGTAAVFTAAIMRSIYLSKLDLKRENTRLLVIITIAALFMLMPKGIFPGICFLPLIVFYGGLGYEKLKKLTLFIATFLTAILWQKLGVAHVMWHGSPVTSSIFDFPYAFIKTMFVRWVDRDFIYIGDNIGSIPSFPQNSVGMPSITITLMSVLLAAYIFAGYPENNKIRIPKIEVNLLKYSSLIIGIGVIVGSFAALFIAGAHLQDGSLSIRGVSPRYFYPIFFMLALVPFTRSFAAKSVFSFSKMVIVGSLILLSVRTTVLAAYFQWGVF